jgi:radical SAM superfamily enzyme YgiQ (UPF0313 family)
MQPYRPLGTLYAAAALREAGFSVALFDTMLRNPEQEFSAFFAECNPRIVAIYEDDFNFLTKMCLSRMREVAWHITEVARNNAVPIIMHGSDATDHPELFLSHGIDYVLRGEAERTLVEVCSTLKTGAKTGDVAGLVHLNSSSKAIFSDHSLSKNPDWVSLPQPPNDLTDFNLYRQAWDAAHGYFSVNMTASRGCPFRCNWCAKPISGNKFHLRSAAVVAEEMRQLKADVGAQHIWFSDDVFALDRHWIQEFAAEVTARHAALPFKIQSRADLMTDQTVSALKSAGCVEVWMGVESGSQKILDAMDKGLQVSMIEDARRRLREANIRACYFLQFGYPGEQWKELQETIALVRSTKPDDIGISFSYPLPGTAFYERVQAQLGPKRNWSDSDDLCILFEAEYTTDFYLKVREALHEEVDSWSIADGSSIEATQHVDQLWENVFALEPTSKTSNSDVQTPANSRKIKQPAAFISISELAPTVGA